MKDQDADITLTLPASAIRLLTKTLRDHAELLDALRKYVSRPDVRRALKTCGAPALSDAQLLEMVGVVDLARQRVALVDKQIEAVVAKVRADRDAAAAAAKEPPVEIPATSRTH